MKRSGGASDSLVPLIVLCLLGAGTVQAAPTYNASSHGAGTPVSVFGSATPLDESRSTNEPIGPASAGTGAGTFVGSSTTASGNGYLKDASAAALSWAGTGGNGVDVAASSGFSLDDIVITAPLGTPSYTQVYYAYAFTIAGAIDADVTSSVPSLWNAGSSVTFHFGDGNVYGYGGTLGEVSVGVSQGVKSSTDSGVLTGFPLGVLTTIAGDTSRDIYGDDTRGVTTPGATVAVTFTLATDAGVGKESTDAVTGDATAYADFAKTLQLSSTEPVLKFSDAGGNPLAGWTANSTDGCIADNHYLCAPAPEPRDDEMMSLSCVVLGLLTRRRSARTRSAAGRPPP